MKIILLGYMGSGKTAVGKILADRMNLTFKDLDEEIVQREGKDISQIFADSGEIYFRKMESRILEELMNAEDSFVLALGGGTPCYGNNLHLLKEHEDVTMVYLKTSLQELTRRLFAERKSRPLISHLGSMELLEDFVRKHLFERSYFYNQSSVILETDGRSTNEVVENILSRLAKVG